MQDRGLRGARSGAEIQAMRDALSAIDAGMGVRQARDGGISQSGGGETGGRELGQCQSALVARARSRADIAKANRAAYPWIAAFVDECRAAGFTDVRVEAVIHGQ